MALPPFSPDPGKPEISHNRLRDQAVFLGDLGRNDPNQKIRESKEAFKKVFQDCFEDTEELTKEGEPPQESLQDLSVEDKRDAERKSKQGGEKEAEKRAAWRGPNPLLGLAFNPTLLKPITVGESEQARGQRKSSLNERAGDPASAPVDIQILKELRNGGLKNPITGFNDPRVRDEYALLEAGEGWLQETIPGGNSYHWQQPGGSAFQRLRLSEGTGLIESSAGTTRQIVEKSQGEYRATLLKQGDSQDFPG